MIGEASKQAETAVATAKSQAKQQLDEATARATAIHDGAERRLNLLMSRHTEAIRRLTEIRDVVTSLVAGEADRGSLEDEVARIVTSAVGADAQAGRARQRPPSRPGRGTARRRQWPAPGGGPAGPVHGSASRPAKRGLARLVARPPRDRARAMASTPGQLTPGSRPRWLRSQTPMTPPMGSRSSRIDLHRVRRDYASR